MEEATAQITLIQQKIDRATVKAPFDAVVVQGDLSQSLGLAIRQGHELFRLAPLSSYRLAVFVDERDIRDLRTGQVGHLVLSALPGQTHEIRIDRITPITTAGQGRNTFRVEAKLLNTPSALRPGMTGVAKVEIGERLLIWIWTRRFVHWLQLQIWSWWP
jgi:multidrug resistance efflux pump